MKLLALVNGGFAAVSPEDFDQLSLHKWRAVEVSRGYVYACRNVGTKRIRMHRVICDAPAGLVVDHINGNTLDNRRENLRAVTNAENLQNVTRPVRSSTGHRNVFAHRTGYVVKVSRFGVLHRGGFHDNLESAIAARDALLAAIVAPTKQAWQMERRA